MVYWAVLGLSATERLPYHDNEWGRPAGRSPACEGCPAERCCGLAGRMVADGVAFLLFGFALLLGGVAALLAGWTLTGCHSCCSESRPC
jgi:hypothetical protein